MPKFIIKSLTTIFLQSRVIQFIILKFRSSGTFTSATLMEYGISIDSTFDEITILPFFTLASLVFLLKYKYNFPVDVFFCLHRYHCIINIKRSFLGIIPLHFFNRCSLKISFFKIGRIFIHISRNKSEYFKIQLTFRYKLNIPFSLQNHLKASI